MIGLDPTTVAEAGPVMAKAYGLTWPEDRLRVIELINKYRQLLYTDYEKYRLFDNVFHCICLTQFYQICSDECTYTGITLPTDVLSVEAVFDNGHPLTLRSRWREAKTGIGHHGSRLDSIEVAETFSTERGLQEATTLRVFAEREEDRDKLMHVKVMTCEGLERSICFRLIPDAWAVSKIKIKRIISVALPTDRVGYIKIAQKNGYELSQYSPNEQTVPVYRRFKIDKCASGTVLIQGVKKFQKVYFDHDIVEIGNILILESAAKYFKYGDTTTDGNELRRAQYDLKEMDQRLKGLIARHQGHSTQEAPFNGKRPRSFRKTLPGYRR